MFSGNIQTDRRRNSVGNASVNRWVNSPENKHSLGIQ